MPNDEGMTLMMNDEGKYFYACRSRVVADTAASTTITAWQANDEGTKQTPNAECRGLRLKFGVRCSALDVRCFLPRRGFANSLTLPCYLSPFLAARIQSPTQEKQQCIH